MDELQYRILRRWDRLCRIGWIDYSSDSWDYRCAQAQAWRIKQRQKGRRISLAQALTD